MCPKFCYPGAFRHISTGLCYNRLRTPYHLYCRLSDCQRLRFCFDFWHCPRLVTNGSTNIVSPAVMGDVKFAVCVCLSCCASGVCLFAIHFLPNCWTDLAEGTDDAASRVLLAIIPGVPPGEPKMWFLGRHLGVVVSNSFVRWQHNRGHNCVSIALTNLLFVIIVVYTGSRKKLRMADL